MNDHDRFYNDLSDRLGLPRTTVPEGWAEFGRRLIPGARARSSVHGLAFYGIESTEVVPAVKQEPAKSLGQQMREILARGPVIEPVADFEDAFDEMLAEQRNAAMVARDEKAKQAERQLDAISAAVATEPPASTTYPSPFASFRSPDLCATSHQVDPAHQLKGWHMTHQMSPRRCRGAAFSKGQRGDGFALGRQARLAGRAFYS